jgi:hypothetical protein
MCGVSVEYSDDFRRNIDAFRTNLDFLRTNVDAFHRNVIHAFHTNVDAFRRNFMHAYHTNVDAFRRNFIHAFHTNEDAFRRNVMHAFHTNVDAFRRNLKLMHAHSLVTMVTAVLYYAKWRHVNSVRTNLLFQIAIFVPCNGGHKATSKIVQAIVVYDKCLV